MGVDSASIMRKLYEGIDAKDPDAIAALAADDFVLIDCASGEKFEGPEGAKRNAAGWMTRVFRCRGRVAQRGGVGRLGVLGGRRARHSHGPDADADGRSRTDRKADGAPFLQRARGAGRQDRRERDYYDTMTVANRLGLMSVPAASS
jgi:SnoaL-like domain